MNFAKIPVDDIVPNPKQPRKSIRNIQRLVNSIKEVGLINPIKVVKKDIKFKGKVRHHMIECGERRWTAFRMLKRKTIACFIVSHKPYEMLADNLVRDPLCLLEKIEGVQSLLHKKFGDDWKKLLARLHNNPTVGSREKEVEKTCKAIGMAPTTIYLALPVLNLKEQAKKTILNNLDYFNDGVILKLARIKDERLQIEISKTIVKKEFTGGKALTYITQQSWKHNLSPQESFWKYFMYRWSKDSSVFINRLNETCEFGKAPEHFRKKFLNRVAETRDTCNRILKKNRQEM